MKENNWNWLKEPWIKVSLIAYLWLIITSFFAFNETLALSRSISWVRFIILAASLQFLFLNNEKYKNRLIICLIISLLYVNIEMFFEYFTGSSLYSKLRVNVLDLDFYSGGYRVSGPFKDAPKSGIFIAYFLFPCLFGIHNFIKNKINISYSMSVTILFLIINLFLIYISGHRASLLSAIISISIILCFLIFRIKNYKIILLLFFFTSLIIFSTIKLVPQNNFKVNFVEKTFKEIKNYQESAYGSLATTSFKMFKSNPVTGIGLKNYRIVCEKDEFLSKGHLGTGYGVSPWKGHYNVGLKKYYEPTCSSHPHNLYLTWLAETGLLGLFLFIIILATVIIKVFNNKKILLNQLVCAGIILSLIPKLLPMMPSLNFFSNWNSICFWFLLGWLLSFLHKKKSI